MRFSKLFWIWKHVKHQENILTWFLCVKKVAHPWDRGSKILRNCLKKYFLVCPIWLPVFSYFFYMQWTRIGCVGIDPGMGLTPLPSSIGRGSNPRNCLNVKIGWLEIINPPAPEEQSNAALSHVLKLVLSLKLQSLEFVPSYLFAVSIPTKADFIGEYFKRFWKNKQIVDNMS